MLLRVVAILLIASLSRAQIPGAPAAPAAAPSSHSIGVPAGTLVALKLITSVRSKSTRPGDPVRAVVTFPLAIGALVAIPAGTYVEGVVNKVNARSSSVRFSFSRLLFANGYSVPLVAANTQSILIAPRALPSSADQLADARDGAPFLGTAFADPGQINTQPPPLPSIGPSPGKVAAIGIGVGAGITVLVLALSHHHAANADYVLFDSGWQFQMALQQPLSLDPAQVSAASALAY